MRFTRWFIGSALLIQGCDIDSTCGEAAWPTDGWSEPCAGEAPLDAERLAEARDYAMAPERHTQAVVVIHRGLLVAEWYAEDRDASWPASSWSMAKSFAASLVGIAIDEGLIDSVEVPLAETFPDWAGTEREDIVLGDVLSMASGLDWDEGYSDLDSDVVRMFLADDALEVAASTELAAAPGTRFSYSSGDTMLLSGVLEAATGTTAGAYAEEVLFAPLGLEQAAWWQDAAGHTLTFCCIDATPRELAKLGYLHLQGGHWDGTQVIDEQWVARATSPTVDPGYGYQWWVGGLPTADPAEGVLPVAGVPGDMFTAIGLDHQYIHVVPSLELIVVRTALYDAAPGEAVATDGLIGVLMPSGLGSYGTQAPSDWDSGELLRPLVAAAQAAR